MLLLFNFFISFCISITHLTISCKFFTLLHLSRRAPLLYLNAILSLFPTLQFPGNIWTCSLKGARTHSGTLKAPLFLYHYIFHCYQQEKKKEEDAENVTGQGGLFRGFMDTISITYASAQYFIWNLAHPTVPPSLHSTCPSLTETQCAGV